MSGMLSIILADDEVALIEGTIVAIEIGGCVGRLIKRAVRVPGGRCIRGTIDEFDELLGGLSREIRGFLKLDEERTGRALRKPVAGSTAARLTTIYDNVEKQLS